MLKAPLASPGTLLREMMSKDLVVLPGCFNAISAKLAVDAGAKGLYLSGAGVTNALMAIPDIALISLEEMSRQARYVCQVAPVPVVADADTGYGSAISVSRTVVEMEQCGLGGIHIEDQVSPKRCGHLDGKQLISKEEMCAKVRAAIESKSDPSFLLIARTDARGVEGLEAAIERARAYADAGADAIFPEGLESEAEFEAFRKALEVPLLANMTEFGKTPLMSSSKFKELGYNLVIFPMTAFRVMLKAIGEAYVELLSIGSQAGLLDRMRTRAELYETLEYEAYNTKDQRWSEGAHRRGD